MLSTLFRHSKVAALALLAVAALLSGLGCKGGDPAAQQILNQQIKLTYWRVFDDPSSLDDVINAYRSSHPNVTVEQKIIRYEDFELELLNALAEDRGPDLFSIHNTWVTKYQGKILPMPQKLRIPIVTTTGDIKRERKALIQETNTPTIPQLKDVFVSVVTEDVVREGRVLGLPLAVDTLALLYNRDLLNQAGVAEPPRTWAEIKEASKKLTLQDANGNIVRSGIALGGSANINRAADIISLLMMQNGAEMTNGPYGEAIFSKVPKYIQDSNYRPGLEAVRFYTDFANPQKEVYTWNETFPESVYSFLQWKTAMILAYSYQLPFIRAQAPKLDFGVIPVPHITPERLDAIGKEINFANYWVEVVSKKTAHPEIAWDFLLFATGKEGARMYLKKTGRPTALRSLVNEQLSDPTLNVFASQVLTAKSWYRGREPQLVEQYFKNMVELVLGGIMTLEDAVKHTEGRVNETY